MDLLDHLAGEVFVGYYHAPDHAQVVPTTIPTGFELVEILTAGTVYFEVEGRRREFGPGTIFWHLAGDSTICETTVENPYQCLVLKLSVLKRQRLRPRVGIWGDGKVLNRFADEVLSSFHRPDCDHRLLAAYVYSTLLWHSRISQSRDPERIERPSPISKAMKFIETNFAAGICVEDIAESAGISKSHLFTLFRGHFGQGPHGVLREHRLLKARTRLVSGEDGIKEIAAECGFENIECFYRAFKQTTGMTPGEFRTRNNPYPLAE